LKAGRESIGRESRFDEAAAAAGTGHWVSSNWDSHNDEWFDAGLFGLSPREAGRMEPLHRVLLESAWEALEDGGCSPQAVGARIGVFAGGNFTSYFSLTAD